jgi:hypothetical protein
MLLLTPLLLLLADHALILNNIITFERKKVIQLTPQDFHPQQTKPPKFTIIKNHGHGNRCKLPLSLTNSIHELESLSSHSFGFLFSFGKKACIRSNRKIGTGISISLSLFLLH